MRHAVIDPNSFGSCDWQRLFEVNNFFKLYRSSDQPGITSAVDLSCSAINRRFLMGVRQIIDGDDDNK
jgi:hypothetical protein